MTKHICDRCKKDISKKFYTLQVIVYTESEKGNMYGFQDNRGYDLCEECCKKTLSEIADIADKEEI